MDTIMGSAMDMIRGNTGLSFINVSFIFILRSRLSAASRAGGLLPHAVWHGRSLVS